MFEQVPSLYFSQRSHCLAARRAVRPDRYNA